MRRRSRDALRSLAPWLPYALGVGGGLALACPDAPSLQVAGVALVIAGAVLLFLQARRALDFVERLLEALPYGEAGRDPLRELPRAWSALEQEVAELRARSERGDRLRQAILAHLRVGVVLLGPEHQVRSHNPAAELLLGSGSRLSEGASLAEAFREPESLRCITRAFAGETAEWHLARGARRILARARPFPAEVGDDGGSVLITLDDVTRQEALETTRQKFISNAGHELKTPVASLRIAAENLQDGGLVLPEGEGTLRAIFRAVERMTLLLEDVSELSRIETGALRLAPEPVQVGPFVQALLEDLRPQASARRIALHAEVEPGFEVHTFQADPHRLHQMLDNLLSNALKFGPEGSTVRLRVRRDAPWMAWSVHDEGPGIAPADRPRIFERFYRAPAARSVPGTGLGLAITKHLALLMDGEVTLEEEGPGATFTLRLPLAE